MHVGSASALNALLKVEALSVKMAGRTILDNLTFSLKGSGITAIIGPNGAGKSTLLRTLSGDVVPSSGDTHFLSEPLHSWDSKSLALRLSVLPQVSQLNFPFLVEDVITLSRMPHSTGRTCDNLIIDYVMNKMDIYSLRHSLYTQLSGGEKQRVHIARVIAQLMTNVPIKSSNISLSANDRSVELGGDRLLLLDEPTAALDIEHQHLLMRWLRALKKQSISTLMVMHDFNLAAQYADTLISISEGRIAAVGAPEAVLTSDHLRQVFNVPATIVAHPDTGRPIVLTH